MTEGPWYRRHRFAVDVAIATWYRRHWLAMDVAVAVFFVLLDTGATLVGATWWPAHPSPLAWACWPCRRPRALRWSSGAGRRSW